MSSGPVAPHAGRGRDLDWSDVVADGERMRDELDDEQHAGPREEDGDYAAEFFGAYEREADRLTDEREQW